ncbi:hypothetical protein [Cellulomonas dongxiuzhuiae]|uniref:Uncharacterized protein n=1 Tax=Cellulomonas dongxiuzhuiae TaxID=2819979 RepID=A0ABX8GLF6_9CELL|nr:hypothetical protein [Cellulomonas dongxiuzhuiae]MBO3095470.1 hypothetical protein [Cellulomonas dongxiuzhuiae]QWC16451.1 hypothetical protein KKR89_01880 [Cellulomonas dongxiuzhuiae]
MSWRFGHNGLVQVDGRDRRVRSTGAAEVVAWYAELAAPAVPGRRWS